MSHKKMSKVHESNSLTAPWSKRRFQRLLELIVVEVLCLHAHEVVVLVAVE